MPALTLDALPAPARARVVALTADVLPAVVQLPPALRRVAEFAPARRARLGTGAITAALADDEFRERVATQLGARPVPADPDAAERAALGWLLRAEGWEPAVEAAVAELAERSGASEEAETARLRERLDQAEQTLREVRAAHRVQVEEQKAEIAALRRKLGESRSAERAAREAAAATGAVGEVRSAAEAAAAAADKEVRRLRGQLERAEAEASAGRRAVRTQRDEASLRARLLLDTVLEAASGLQRELGLPPVSGAPADRVEQALAEAGAPTGGAPSAVPGGATPAMLEQFLAMPRARLLVDGYNVSKTAWPESSLEAQRTRLLSALAPVVARTGAETTVVFDAASSSTRPVVNVPRGVKVIFSPEGVIADDVLREIVAAEPRGRVVVVVSSDRAVATDVARAGARAVASEALLALLARSS